MRLRRHIHAGTGVEAINATPLVDVVMCLIVFFLIVGKLATENGPAVPLPRTNVGQDEQSASVMIVTISRAAEGMPKIGWGAYGIEVHADGQPTSNPKDLENAVRGKLAANPAASIQIRGDRNLAWGAISPVLDAARNGGASSTRMATERLP